MGGRLLPTLRACQEHSYRFENNFQGAIAGVEPRHHNLGVEGGGERVTDTGNSMSDPVGFKCIRESREHVVMVREYCHAHVFRG